MMVSRVPRKSAQMPVRATRHQPLDDGEDSPSKQLNFEASTMQPPMPREETLIATHTAHLNEAPQIEESVNILRSASKLKGTKALTTGQKPMAGKRLKAPTTVERTSPRKRKAQGQAVYDFPDEEEPDQKPATPEPAPKKRRTTINVGQIDEAPAPAEPTTPRTRRAAQEAAESPTNTRQTRADPVTKSPKATTWSKRDEKRLMEFIDNGDGYELIHDKMPQYIVAEIRDHATDLLQARRDAEIAARETEVAQAKAQEDASTAPIVRPVRNAPSEARPSSAAGRNPKASRGEPWTVEDEDDLVRMWNFGNTMEVLKERFPGRTEPGIKGRWQKLKNQIKEGKRRAPTPIASESPAPEGEGGDDPEEVADSIEEAPQNNNNDVDDTFMPEKYADVDDAEGSAESDDARASEEEEDAVPDVLKANPAKKSKKAAATGKKASEHQSDDVLPDHVALYDQTEILIKVFKEAHDFQTGSNPGEEEVSHREEFEERKDTEPSSIKAIGMNSAGLCELFDKLTRTSRVQECCAVIDQKLMKLSDRVKHLDPENERWGKERRELARQINLFVVADLLSVLKAALLSYITKGPAENEELKLWYLESWITILSITKKLYDRSRTWKNVRFSGIGRIKNKMLAPLLRVLKAFTNEWKAVERAVMQSTQAERRQAALNQKREREEQEAQLRLEWDDKYRRLRGLFVYRQEAARVFNAQNSRYKMSFKTEDEWKRGILPYDSSAPEFDADGELFVREGVFGRRKRDQRPPPSQFLGRMEEEDEWTDTEKAALVSGLYRLEDEPQLFRALFKMFGQPGQLLYRRTVPEILRMTEAIVDVYRISREEAEDELEEGDFKPGCPSYLKNIPDLDLIELLR